MLLRRLRSKRRTRGGVQGGDPALVLSRRRAGCVRHGFADTRSLSAPVTTQAVARPREVNYKAGVAPLRTEIWRIRAKRESLSIGRSRRCSLTSSRLRTAHRPPRSPCACAGPALRRHVAPTAMHAVSRSTAAPCCPTPRPVAAPVSASRLRSRSERDPWLAIAGAVAHMTSTAPPGPRTHAFTVARTGGTTDGALLRVARPWCAPHGGASGYKK